MRIINLDGQDGNSFNLLATATSFAKQLGLDHKAITNDMMSGDRNHLLKTFQKHFSDYCVLESETENINGDDDEDQKLK
tara:strand:+ start:1360 stop:1596 length:237 start_codon:yes stop_codon:yes gene_type:complete